MATFRFAVGGFAAADDTGIGWYELDADRASLRRIGAVRGITNPSYLVPSRDGRVLYATSETTTDSEQVPSVCSLHIDADGVRTSGELATGGDLPTQLSLHPSGRWLAVANYGTDAVPGSVTIVELDAAGEFVRLAEKIVHTGRGSDHERQTCAHVHSTVFSPTGSELVAADLGTDTLVVYAFDERTGGLSPSSTSSTPPGWGPRYLRWSETAATLYVVGELAREVAAYSWDESRRSLTERGRVATTEAGTGSAAWPSDLQLGTRRSQLYVANRGPDDIAVFARGASGRLDPVGRAACGGNWPRALAVAGELIIVANQRSDEITVLATNERGVPTERVASATHPAPSCISFLGDGSPFS